MKDSPACTPKPTPSRPAWVVSEVTRSALPGRIQLVSPIALGGASVVTRSAWSMSSTAFAPITRARHGVAACVASEKLVTGVLLPPRQACCIRYTPSASPEPPDSIIRG